MPAECRCKAVARLRVTIRSDGLAAELQASAGPPMTAAEVQAVLSAAEVVHGVDATVLAAFTGRLADPKWDGKVTIGQGEGAVVGADGRLEGAFLTPKLPGMLHSDGHIDYHERGLLHPVATDQEVARIIPPTTGKAGRDVRGRVLTPKPCKPHAERCGPGVRIDGDRVVAASGGVILHTERLIDVVPLHVHKGDLDLRSGNLHTHGSLQVQGDVHEGGVATADGAVHVTGAVLDGSVTAGASLRVDQGALGEHCVLQAGEDLLCRHATSARLQAGRMLELGDQATHCRLRANHIRVVNGHGAVFGGEVRGKQSIEVRTAGTASGASTLLSVCDLIDEQTDLVRLQADAARIDRATLRSQRGEDVRLAGGKGIRMATRAQDRSQQERLRILARQRELLSQAFVRITDTANIGVTIQFGSTRLTVMVPIQGADFRFDIDQNKIVQRRLQ